MGTTLDTSKIRGLCCGSSERLIEQEKEWEGNGEFTSFKKKRMNKIGAHAAIFIQSRDS